MFRQQVSRTEIERIEDFMEVKTMLTKIAESIEKKGIRKVAKNMKEEGYSVEEIQKVTGLTTEEIEKL